MCKLVAIKNNKGDLVSVADIKSDIIQKIMQLAAECDKIDYVFVFGSSVEERCTVKSDIDIAIVSNITRSRLFRTASYDRFISRLYEINLNQDYDILQFDSLNDITDSNENVCFDIKNKGVLLYERMAV